MAEKVIFEWHASDDDRDSKFGFLFGEPGAKLPFPPAFACGIHVAPGWTSLGMRDTLDFFQSMYGDLYEDEGSDV
jgi:hypothetical protein